MSKSATYPRISVIIPTFNRIQSLLNTIKDVRQQDYPNFEILVINQTPELPPVLKQALEKFVPDSVIRYFRQQDPNASAARNRGIVEATGEILLFLDDDVRIEQRDFLCQHARNYADSHVSGVVGQILNVNREVRHDRHPWSYRPKVGWLYFPLNYAKRIWIDSGGAGNLSVRRTLALEVGGMDENFEKGAHREEADFCLRCVKRGARFIFDPQASLIHLAEPTGGIRSWGLNRGIHPLHHVTGEMYFIFKNVERPYYPDHLACALRRQVFNRSNMRRPWQMLQAIGRMLRGCWRAWRQLRHGPQYLAKICK